MDTWVLSQAVNEDLTALAPWITERALLVDAYNKAFLLIEDELILQATLRKNLSDAEHIKKFLTIINMFLEHMDKELTLFKMDMIDNSEKIGEKLN